MVKFALPSLTMYTVVQLQGNLPLGFQIAQAYVILRIKTRSKSSICVLAVLDDTADSRDETIPNFSKELKIEI